jgi:hypothetical protein
MKLKVVIVDFELSARAKRLVLGVGVPAFILGAATIAYANVPNVFSSGEVLTAAALNANFALHDTEIAALQSSVNALQSSVTSLQTASSTALTTIIASNLNLTDSASADWEPFATTCFDQLVNINSVQCTGNACASIPVACTIAAERKCVEDLGYRFGFFNGEAVSGPAESIICVK